MAYLIRYIVDPGSDIYIFRENENIPPYIFMGIIVALFFGLIISAEEIFKDAKILKREAFLNLSRSSYLASKIVILFSISAIQMALFVIVGNYIIGFEGMSFAFWVALFSVMAFSNILGLIISASFNSIITIYILIPLLIIPQMVLGGAMFSLVHSNFILNIDNAKATDVYELIQYAISLSKEKININLIPEVELFNWRSYD